MKNCDKCCKTQICENFKPKTIAKWDDLPVINGYIVNENSDIETVDDCMPTYSRANIFPTEKLANAALLLAQLKQVERHLNGNWAPKWTDVSQEKYTITNEAENGLQVAVIFRQQQWFSFKSFETAQIFMENNKNELKRLFSAF